MATQQQLDVRELIRAHRVTREVTGITQSEGDKIEDGSPKADTRFVEPARRRPIKEDSGTYSVVFKKG